MASSLAATRPASPRSSESARPTSARMASASSGRSTSTRARDRSAEFTSKLGFSVVAPINTMSPRSTCARNASCCALLKRWISSTNRIVGWPVRRRACAARSMTSFTSLTPESTAEICTNGTPAVRAIRRASVVLPVPGGPHRTMLVRCRPSRISTSGLPSSRRCSCPTNSSNARGRMRSASGAFGPGSSSPPARPVGTGPPGASPNRSPFTSAAVRASAPARRSARARRHAG